jgi:two-component system, cell cycle sensor histidine kinase and response regulator CckA
MSANKKNRQIPRVIIFIFLLLIIIIFVADYSYYQFQRKRVIEEKQDELTAIADLKIMQISQWRNERLGDAEMVFENAVIARQVRSCFQSPNEPNRKKEVLSWLRSFLKSYEYTASYLLDTLGAIRFSSHTVNENIPLQVQELFKEAIIQKKSILTDFQRTDDSLKNHISLIIPILLTDKNNSTVVGILLLNINPERMLFPLIKMWPTGSRSSETLLVERDGDDVVFLNELRHLKNTASALRIPISNEKLPAAMAVHGNEGIVEGIDYRGVPVLAVMRKIPDSPWFMVSKVDQEEVYAPLLFQTWLIGSVTIILVIALGVFFSYWWRNRQYQAKVERLALIKHFEYLVKYAHDIYILANEDLKIIEVNDRALETYGYTRDEMLTLNARDLHIIQPEEVPEKYKTEITHEGVTFESIHRRKNGNVFPVELSIRVIDIEGKIFHQAIIRDITERKEAEIILKKSEEKFRSFADQSPNMIFINYNGKVVYVNEKCIEQMGYTKEEFYSSDFNFLQLTAPEYVELLKEKFLKHSKGEEVPAYEYALLTRQGKRMDVIITTNLIPYENGKAILGIITDITERKKAEELLQKFQLGIERSPDAIFITDPSGAIVFVNTAFEQLYGYSLQESIGKTPRILKSGSMSLEDYKQFWNILLSKNIVSGEIVNKTKDGRRVNIEGTNNPILDDHGTIIGFLGIHRDITDRKQKEEKSQQSFSLLQATLESTADGILVVDLNGNIANYNVQFIKMWNIPEGVMKEGRDREAINFVLSQLISPKDFVKKVNELYSKPEEESFDVLEFKDGRIFERYSRPQRIGGQPVGRVWSFRDITQRKLAEQQLQESEERYRRLVEYSPDAIAVHCEGKFVFANPASVKLIGAADESQIIGLSVMSVIHPDYIETVQQRMLIGIKERIALPPLEEKFIRLDGSIIDVEVTSFPIIFRGKLSTQVVVRDTTEQKKLQYQFFQSQKIQSIGTLAGGIAHDFNNILAIILGYSSTLERNRNDSKKHSEGIAAINQAIDRGAALVRQILTFARKTDVIFEPVNIPDLIHELLSMLKETFSKTITFTQTYTPDIPEIIADRTQIHQTLLNLCVNSRDAMPNGGSITIKAEQWKREDVRRRFPSASEEMYICISVTDTGVGMNEATYLRAFDPFFTTKEKGKGTGLGLSVVYGVMQSHHGFVDVESHVGMGTTFYLFFPVSNIEEQSKDTATQENEKPSGGTETILVVEDEYLILRAIRRLLKSYGYTVFVAADGEEAIDVFTRHKDEITIVLSDVGLSKMNGIDVFKKIREIDPQMKVILASGFFEPDLKFSLQKMGARGFIQKPYSNDDVLRKLREILDEK